MKIEYYSDKIVTYLINRHVKLEVEDIKQLLYDVLNNLIENYNIDIRNNYDINIYINDLYGIVVELIKINSDSHDDFNSIGLNIVDEKLFLYEIDDPLDYIDNEIYYYDDKFYLNIKNIDINLFENVKIIYDDYVYKVLGRGVKI